MIELGDRTAYHMLILYCILMSLATLVWNRLTDIVFIIMAVNCIYMFNTQKRLILDTFMILLSSFFVYSALTIFWSSNILYALGTNISIIQRIAFAICVYWIVDSHERVEKIVLSILLGGIFAFLYLYYVYGLNGLMHMLASESSSRLGADITNANNVGNAFSLAALAAWYFALRKKKKVIYGALFIVFFVFLVASGSRTNFFGLLAGMIICSYFLSENGKITKVVITVFAIYVIYTLIKSIGLMPAMIARFDNAIQSLLGKEELKWGASSRREFTEYGIGKIIQNPIIGYGAGQFRYYMGAERGLAYSSHNNYVEVFFSYGMIGGLIWYGMYVYSFMTLLKKNTHPENIIICSFIIMRLISDVSSHSVSTTLPYLLLALAFSCIRIDQDAHRVGMFSRVNENLRSKSIYIR